MSSFTRNDLKNWFRDTHRDAQPAQPASDDGLLTESYGDMNDPNNPDANPDLVSREMAGSQDDPPFFSGQFAQRMEKEMGAASAAADRLEDDLADAIADAVSAGVGLKEIASAVEMALFGAMMHTTGREMDYKVEITPTPVPGHRSAFQRK